MRNRVLAIGALVGLLFLPGLANAVPAAPSAAQTVVAAQPEFLPVRDGCGRDFHLAQWQDRWGRWHRRCVPFRGWDRDRWSGGQWEDRRWRRGWGGYYR